MRTYKPKPREWKQCACGCGLLVKGTKRRKYVDASHRQRGHRAKAPAGR